MFDSIIFENPGLLSVGIAVASSLVLGFLIYLQNSKNLTNRAFLYFTVISSFWGIANYLFYQLNDEILALWSVRLVMFFAVWQAFTFFQLTYSFPDTNINNQYPPWLRHYLFPACLIISFLTLTPFIFRGLIKPETGMVPITIHGPGLPIFGVLAVGLVLAGIVFLIRRILITPKTGRQPYYLFLSGLASMFGLIIIFNFLLPVIYNEVKFIPLGAVFILPFVFSTFYAIMKYHLLNTKIIATEIIALVLTITIFFEVLITKNTTIIIFRSGIFLLVLAFSILLIRSVRHEVVLREREEHLNHQLAQANEQLKELLQMKSEFLDIASHQLRTPLSAMIGLLSMQYDGDFDALSKAEQKEQQKNMLVSAERLRGIVNDLMDAMEVEGGIKPKLTKTDVEKLVSEAINTLKPNYDKKGLYLNYEKPAASLPQVSADKTFLAQVFMNLIDNACQYTEQGGVAIKLFPEQNGVTFEIKDSGMGISEKEKKRVFGKFERSQRAKLIHPDGSGLGLFIVKKIVDAHGGKIETQSAGEGQGATFKVWLPAAAAIPVIDNNLITIKS